MGSEFEVGSCDSSPKSPPLDDEIGMVLPLAYFASGGELFNDQDDEVIPFTQFGGIGLKCIYPWGQGGRLMR